MGLQDFYTDFDTRFDTLCGLFRPLEEHQAKHFHGKTHKHRSRYGQSTKDNETPERSLCKHRFVVDSGTASAPRLWAAILAIARVPEHFCFEIWCMDLVS